MSRRQDKTISSQRLEDKTLQILLKSALRFRHFCWCHFCWCQTLNVSIKANTLPSKITQVVATSGVPLSLQVVSFIMTSHIDYNPTMPRCFHISIFTQHLVVSQLHHTVVAINFLNGDRITRCCKWTSWWLSSPYKLQPNNGTLLDNSEVSDNTNTPNAS